jgi:hypothetical protein
VGSHNAQWSLRSLPLPGPSTDRLRAGSDALEIALAMRPSGPDGQRMVFIHSTLKMEHALLSEGLLNDVRANGSLEALSDPPPSASTATATLTWSVLGSGIRPTLEDLPAVLSPNRALAPGIVNAEFRRMN